MFWVEEGVRGRGIDRGRSRALYSIVPHSNQDEDTLHFHNCPDFTSRICVSITKLERGYNEAKASQTWQTLLSSHGSQ
jgi:hypothetical protein